MVDIASSAQRPRQALDCAPPRNWAVDIYEARATCNCFMPWLCVCFWLARTQTYFLFGGTNMRRQREENVGAFSAILRTVVLSFCSLYACWSLIWTLFILLIIDVIADEHLSWLSFQNGCHKIVRLRIVEEIRSRHKNKSDCFMGSYSFWAMRLADQACAKKKSSHWTRSS